MKALTSVSVMTGSRRSVCVEPTSHNTSSTTSVLTSESSIGVGSVPRVG